MLKAFSKSVTIRAGTDLVWQFLTEPELVERWMGEPDMQLEILTDWKQGSDLIIKGFHHANFENRGKIIIADPFKQLRYTHLSSLSRLEDKKENYAVLDFRLEEKEDTTILLLTIENCPTQSIYKHLEFYWGTTLYLLKHCIEINN